MRARTKVTGWWIVTALAILGLASLCPAWGQAPAKSGQLVYSPVGSVGVDIQTEGKGGLHMVYVKDDNAYYMRSRDYGKNFSEPIKLNGDVSVIGIGDYGPKLAVGRDRVIHVVWRDRVKPGEKAAARYTRSTNGGRSFEAPKVISDMPGTAGVTLATDSGGNVVAFWHAADDRKPDVPQATWLYLARSTNNGATFNDPEPVKITGATGLASAGCQMRARMGIEGNVYLAYRGAEGGVRDIYMLLGKITENDFSVLRVNQDNWQSNTCPTNGPELTLDGIGRPLCAFMSKNLVFWAFAGKNPTKFMLHVGAPNAQFGEVSPTLVANTKQVLFVWQVGPLTVGDTATVHYAVYDLGGNFSDRQGILGTIPSQARVTAFAGVNELFYIVIPAAE